MNAVALAAIYALLATAYSLIYGLVGRINLAFGEIAVLGAYGAVGGVAAAVALGVGDVITGLALAFVLAAAISAGWSVLVGRVVIAPLHASACISPMFSSLPALRRMLDVSRAAGRKRPRG